MPPIIHLNQSGTDRAHYKRFEPILRTFCKTKLIFGSWLVNYFKQPNFALNIFVSILIFKFSSQQFSQRQNLCNVMNTPQVSFQVGVLAENFAAHWTGSSSLVGVQVPLVGDFLPKFPRADFTHKCVLWIAWAAVTFVVIDFTQNKSTLITLMRNLIGALAQLIHIDVFYVCEQLSLTSKS